MTTSDVNQPSSASRPEIGSFHAPHDSSDDSDDSRREPIAVPYWPQLKRVVGSVNAALVVAYLEARFPSPPPEPGRRYGLPCTVDFRRMAEELVLDRRTLYLSLTWICTWFEREVQRIGAVRVGREFVNLKHNRAMRLKLYSVVAPRGITALRTLTLRRNWPHLTATLQQCSIEITSPQTANSCGNLDRAGALPSPFESLPEILLRGVALGGGRRKVGRPTTRRAVNYKPVGTDASTARRLQDTEAVDPELSDAMIARMSAGCRRDLGTDPTHL